MTPRALGGLITRRYPHTLVPSHPHTLILPPGEPLDLELTFRCGQVFRWRLHGDMWYGPFGRGALAIRQVPRGVEFRTLGINLRPEEVCAFLALNVPLRAVEARLSHDSWVRAAFEALPGLRILRQDPWECLASFVCSQWNNIPKIELSTDRIARRWGTVHRWENGVETASFPAPEILAALPETALRESALGYRCRYLVETAKRVASGGIDLYDLRRAPYEEALAALLELPGVGRKVADCVLLFGLDQPRACPVDVWVRRLVHELYPRELAVYLPDADVRVTKGLSAREHAAVLRFAWERWGSDAGYAQQYLFTARRGGLSLRGLEAATVDTPSAPPL